jgi:hypothetical protein
MHMSHRFERDVGNNQRSRKTMMCGGRPQPIQLICFLLFRGYISAACNEVPAVLQVATMGNVDQQQLTLSISCGNPGLARPLSSYFQTLWPTQEI